MPLPWKKSHVGRISRLVSDLQSSSRNGGSLVVQTGFPTSLIDLFVKNRDRLKKKKKKKKNKKNEEALEEWEPIVLPSSPTYSSDSSSNVDGWKPSTGAVVSVPLDSSADLTTSNFAPDLESREAIRYAGAFIFVVKVLFMIILAFATKKLAFGITMSTFLLLFLEFFALRVFGFLKPCPDATKTLRSFAEKVLLLFPLPTEGSELETGDSDFDSFNSDIDEEIQSSDKTDRVWASETEISLHEQRWRPEIGFDSSMIHQPRSKEGIETDSKLIVLERRWGSENLHARIYDSSMIHQPRSNEVFKPDSKLIILDRRWGSENRQARRYTSDSDVSSQGKCYQARSEASKFVEPSSIEISRDKRLAVLDSSKKEKISETDDEMVQSASVGTQKTSYGKFKFKKFKKLLTNTMRGSKKAFDQEKRRGSSEDVIASWIEKKVARREEQEKQKGKANPVLVDGNGGNRGGGYGCIVMVLIVLAGLVRGRLMALGLIMFWFLLLKSVQTLKSILKIKSYHFTPERCHG